MVAVQWEWLQHCLMQNHRVRALTALWTKNKPTVVYFDLHIVIPVMRWGGSRPEGTLTLTLRCKKGTPAFQATCSLKMKWRSQVLWQDLGSDDWDRTSTRPVQSRMLRLLSYIGMSNVFGVFYFFQGEDSKEGWPSFPLPQGVYSYNLRLY